MINKLMVFVINTGVLTSICAFIALVMLLVFPDSLIYTAFYFCLGRLYANSILAALNSRKYITDSAPEQGSHTLPSRLNILSLTPASGREKMLPNSQSIALAVQIDTTQEKDVGHELHSTLNRDIPKDQLTMYSNPQGSTTYV